ncbi:MAG: amino acid adenylation domain-containing protein [Pseudoxanthomonas sp.]
MNAMLRPAHADAIDYDPFAGGALRRVAPTTEPQREVWLADKLGEAASLAFNESVCLRLRGLLDASALETALHELVARHDALRANFGPDGETLCVLDDAGFTLQGFDFSRLDADARTAALEARRRAAVDTPFTLEHGSLLRGELLRLADDDHALLLTAHHMVCDGWSWWVMVRELGALYAQRAGAGGEALPPAPSFADYALEQALHPACATHAEDEHYWLSRFAVAPPPLDLPTDRPRPAQRGFASQREDYLLDAALLGAIRSMGARRGASLFATLLAGFAGLLARLTAQADVVIGIPAAGQSVDGHDGLVGHCVNLLPLRCDAAAGKRFSSFLDETQTVLLDAIDHQRHTFGTLLKKLRIERDPSRMPLVSVMFNIDQALDQQGTAFPGLALEFDSNPRSHENFELFVNAVQTRDGMRLECQYNSGLFDAATIRRWLRAYECLLRHAVQQADAPLGELPVVDADGMAGLAALQPPPTPFPARAGMHELFEAQCERTPQRIALRSGEASSTYAQLDARANRIAALLRQRGVRRGALVGLSLDRGTDMLAALLGILKTGAGYVPLDPAFPPDRLAYMVGDAGLAALVTQRDHAHRFDLRGRPVLALDAMADELAAASPARVACADFDAEAPAYVIYTSGSTGKPKGVQVPHRAVSNFIVSMQREPGIAIDDKLVAVTTLSFDIAVLELMLPLSVGAQVVLASRETAMDGELLAALLHDSGATLMQATPATWRLLIDAGWKGTPDFRVLCGGEPLPPALARGLLERCGELWNLYGPTETTVWSTAGRVREPERGISIGTPIANTTVWILDAQKQPCPLGVPGELCIGGDGVTLGYLGRADLTADRFLPDPYGNKPGALLYRTGDRARWRADGTLEHLGRLDFQVKVRGYRIEPGEIETALAACPGVAQSVVLVREDRPGDVRLVGYAVAQPGATLDERNLINRLKGALPDYMLPQHVVALERLPLLPNGKIDRKSLPAPDINARSDGFVAPRNDTERGIAAAMAQVLGLPRIGIHDNFFSLGGHSLLAAQLTSRLNREMKLSLGLRALFDGPTVAKLAEIAGAGDGTGQRKPIERRADQASAPLSLVQERLWLLEQFNPGAITYNTPSGHRLRGPLDAAAFARAFDAMVQRQSVLRTAVGLRGKQAFQQVHDAIDTGLLPVIDLSDLGEADAEAQAIADMNAQIATPFDLSRPPLFRARLYKLAEDHHLFLFLVHHLLWDGWSFDLMYTELSAFYGAFVEGREPQLPELPVSYGDYAAWHREWIEGPEYAKQLAFWRERLGRDRDADTMHAMPTDLPRKPGMAGRSRQHRIALPRDMVDHLQALSLQMDSTLFVTLVSAYFTLLCAVGGQRDLIVATPVRGRNSDQTEPLMGYFTNLLPLRVKLDPAQPFVEALGQVKAMLLDSFANPDIRLEDLTRDLGMRSADGGGQVLYHAMFSFQDVRHRPEAWGNVRHERVELNDPGATQDLGLWLIENNNGLSGAVVYNADTLLPDTVTMLWDRYRALLESLLRDPSQTLASLMRFDDGRPLLMGRSREPVEDAPAQIQPVANPAAEPAAAPVPAAGTLPTQMAAIWANLLGRESVGLDEDFFALGGNSLLAVQMFHRMARTTGVNLPLGRLLDAPTPRLLAAAWREAGARDDVPASASSAGDPWAPLQLLQPGNGKTAPLYLVHAIGGNVLNYRVLAHKLDPSLTIYGIQSLGLDGRTRPLATVPEMAARYVREIRAVQPQGPYRIAGGSMGGLIGYEIAQQLLAAGQQVSFLGLFDTASGRVGGSGAAGEGGGRLRHCLSALSLRRVRDSLASRARMLWLRARVALIRTAGAELPHAIRYDEVHRVHYRAARAYRLKPYPGELVVFRANDQTGRFPDAPTLGWSDLARKVETIGIPGDHGSVIEADELAQALSRLLVD